MLRHLTALFFLWNISALSMAETVTHTFANAALRAEFPDTYRIVENSPARLLLASRDTTEQTLELVIQDLGSEASVRSFLQNEASKLNVEIAVGPDRLTLREMKTQVSGVGRPMRSANSLVGYGTRVISITKTAPLPANDSRESEVDFLLKDFIEIALTIEDENIASMRSPVEDQPPNGEIKALSAQDVCELSGQRSVINKATWFSFEATYTASTHGAIFEVPGCTLTAILSAASSDRIYSYNRAFGRKCQAHLTGAYVRGKFMGTFENRRRHFDSGRAFVINVFIIRDLETNDLSPEKIQCSSSTSETSPG